MKKTDLLIIGGSAGGLLTATAARKLYGDIKITLIRKNKKVMVPCGIPYIFGTLNDTSKNQIPDALLSNAGVELLIDEVVKIDRDKKMVITADNTEIEYDKLVIATGSLPIVPKFIKGYDLENVFPIVKDEEYLKDILEKVKNMSDIVVIGGGFIGVEFAEQMKMAGKNVTLVEVADKCLWQAFDEEFSSDAEEQLKNNGVIVKTKTKVEEIIGDTKVKEVKLSNGETIKADAVILGMGVSPNSVLAKDAGIKVNEKAAIIVDEYMRTNDSDIFAVGDCTEKKCFFTGKNTPILLASTAAMEAKIAACNLFQLKYVRKIKGTISAFSTKVFDKAFAAAGLTERKAKEEGFDIVIGRASTMDKHPGSLPNTGKIDIKLIFAKDTGIILGAQISGGDSIGEMVNILSMAVQNSMTANELNTYQVATHPLLTASPIAYPINAAALDALTKLNK
ncbi:pyridine nucleotide-disulfide oxidoreductase [Crassaminicella thermophila]|uniref:Pyridine nucleotide-disulfide oxidoreductase n=1 Tax=Crassaminicella thermophila TaxID=2599308 RepID=A0A5C0SBQ8_CRATE|nr:FAD-dependent oxidoreductase [Crassaminicella thermophila]QEK11530.1 pyridine nucleotide-disulfide oxidoreductase [Crassaminicella thermophila]